MNALIVIFISALLTLFVSFAKKPFLTLIIAKLGILTAIALLIAQWNNPVVLFNYKGLAFDNTSILYSVAACVFTLLSILLGYKTYSEQKENTGEYIALFQFSLVGAMCMVSFTDMFMFFIGLEIMSIPIYVLAGTNKRDLRSSEASLKYFLMGAFATGILLFGIAWTYGATGTFDIATIGQKVGEQPSSILYLGILLILAAFLFKVGAVPFHFWSPDVYHGSPNNVTGFMAAVVKIGAFGAFLKVFGTAFGSEALQSFWAPVVVTLAVVTMFVGNLSALNQTIFKRLLAYSSITNVGYALLSVVSGDANSQFNLWIFLSGYGVALIALVAISSLLGDDEGKIDAFKGLAKRNPFLATISVLALLSLAGVPPLFGFFGKYLVFASAFAKYPYIVMVAILNSGIGVYYYLKTVIAIFTNDEENSTPIEVPMIQAAVLAFCGLAILIGGIVLA